MASSVIKVDRNYNLSNVSFLVPGNDFTQVRFKIEAPVWNSLIYKDGNGGFGLIIVKDNQAPSFITLNDSSAFSKIRETVSDVSANSFQCIFLGNRRYQLIGVPDIICTQLS